jgi:hypothetical protein
MVARRKMMDTAELRGREIAPDPWIDGVESVEFKTLIDTKQRSIVPMVVIYIVGYMGLSLAGVASSPRCLAACLQDEALSMRSVLMKSHRASLPMSKDSLLPE